MITKTSHTISPGEASSVINASWVASKKGNSSESKKDDNKRNNSNGSRAEKCPASALKYTAPEQQKLFAEIKI